jgi:hypothetical protein
VLNVGILGLATGLLKFNGEQQAPAVVYGLYLAGILCCVLALVAGRVQRTYYRQTKEHKAKLEELLGLGDLSIKTTSGMGGTAPVIAKVTTFHTAILSVVLMLDLLGFSYAMAHHNEANAPACAGSRDHRMLPPPSCHGRRQGPDNHPNRHCPQQWAPGHPC